VRYTVTITQKHGPGKSAMLVKIEGERLPAISEDVIKQTFNTLLQLAEEETHAHEIAEGQRWYSTPTLPQEMIVKGDTDA
jgi:hypothetical protein